MDRLTAQPVGILQNKGVKNNEIYLCYNRQRNADNALLYGGAHTVRRGHFALFEQSEPSGKNFARLPLRELGGGAKTCEGVEK